MAPYWSRSAAFIHCTRQPSLALGRRVPTTIFLASLAQLMRVALIHTYLLIVRRFTQEKCTWPRPRLPTGRTSTTEKGPSGSRLRVHFSRLTVGLRSRSHLCE